MKLAFIPSWYPTAKNPSDGTFFREWAMYFAEAGHDVSVIASLIHPLSRVFTRPFNSSKETLIKNEEGSLTEFIQESINIHPYLEKEFYKRYAERSRTLLKQITEHSGLPDAAIIHSSIWAGGALAQDLSDLGIPFVVFEHLKQFVLPETLTSVQRSAINTSWKNAKHIVAISSKMETAFEQVYPKYSDKVVRLPNPVDTEFFDLKSDNKAGDGFNFVSVALHRPEKRIGHLLRSFAVAVERNSSLTLEIHGDGPDLEKNRKLAVVLGIVNNVRFAGFSSRPEIKAALHQADCFIMSSSVETFGLAALEALSTGIPVISTDCGGPSDFISADNGIIVPVSDDHTVLAEAMIKMVDRSGGIDPRAIRNTIVDQFDKSIYVKRCIELLT